MSKLINPTFGCDPEFFLKKDGEFVPAIGLIGGTKEMPRPLKSWGYDTDTEALLEDNVMVEFNTRPTTSFEEWWENIVLVRDAVKEILPEYEQAIVPSAEFDPKYLESRQAKEFGCDPDFCIWTEEQNRPPKASENIRYAGGHIHIGIENEYDFYEKCYALVKYLDITVGVGSLFLDDDDRRRKFYGKAGNFRIKEYGVEYRSPSNFWIRDEKTFKKLSEWIQIAIDLSNTGFDIDSYRSKILESMNNINRSEAEKLVKEFGLL